MSGLLDWYRLLRVVSGPGAESVLALRAIPARFIVAWTLVPAESAEPFPQWHGQLGYAMKYVILCGAEHLSHLAREHICASPESLSRPDSPSWPRRLSSWERPPVPAPLPAPTGSPSSTPAPEMRRTCAKSSGPTTTITRQSSASTLTRRSPVTRSSSRASSSPLRGRQRHRHPVREHHVRGGNLQHWRRLVRIRRRLRPFARVMPDREGVRPQYPGWVTAPRRGRAAAHRTHPRPSGRSRSA